MLAHIIHIYVIRSREKYAELFSFRSDFFQSKVPVIPAVSFEKSGSSSRRPRRNLFHSSFDATKQSFMLGKFIQISITAEEIKILHAEVVVLRRSKSREKNLFITTNAYYMLFFNCQARSKLRSVQIFKYGVTV